MTSFIRNLENCCRTCLNDSSIQMYELFDDLQSNVCRPNTIVEMLTVCTSLTLSKNDSLPKKLCSSCYNWIVGFYDFKNQAERTDINIRKILEGIDTKHLLKDEYLVIKENNVNINEESNFNLSQNIKDEPDKTKDSNLSNTCCDTLQSFIEESDYSHTDQENVNKSKLKCNTSKQRFRDKSKLEAHKLRHSQSYPCDVCSISFKSERKLLKHLLHHSKEQTELFSEIDPNSITDKNKLFTCVNCNKHFRKASHLKYHEKIHDGTVKPKSFLNEDLIEQEQENQSNIKCHICSSLYKSANALSAHMRVHVKKGRILSCSLCSKVFKKTSHLKRHELSHNVNRPFKCAHCSRSFTMQRLLNDHMLEHATKQYSCPSCQKIFSNICTFRTHIKLHSKDKEYLCPTCGKMFYSTASLDEHIKRHVGLKTFACTLCPSSFVSKGELKSHSITHTGVKPYTCDQCKVSFTAHHSLTKHKLKHLGIKPHKCEVCLRRFLDKDHLKRHFRIHTGEKPYRCDICDRAFTQSNDLVKHKRAHLGDKLYRCDQCPESFRLQTELRQHTSEHFISSKLQGINVGDGQDGEMNADIVDGITSEVIMDVVETEDSASVIENNKVLDIVTS